MKSYKLSFLKNKNIILISVLIIVIVALLTYLLLKKLNKTNKTNPKIQENFEAKMNLNDGLNSVDQILFINLDNRPDRLEAITNQLKSQNVDMSKVHRIPAHYTPGNGHYGCAKSHLDAMKYALNKGYETILVFEDDFKFSTKPEETKDLLNKLFTNVSKDEWDVILLTHSAGVTEKTKHSFLEKITNGQTSSAYIIGKNYYPILINTFQKCIDNMPKEKTSEVNHEQWALDQVWKKNQKEDKWMVFKPLIGEQDSKLVSTIQSITNYNT
jgi:GR25 family glycosyltransferase involved in LPS biosynthesis